jgi:hypothetical protein
MAEPRIINMLQAVIQKDVMSHYGHCRPTLRGVEEVRKFAQERLDLYVEKLKKESQELRDLWVIGHPLAITAKISVNTRDYQIEITTKDDPKAS